MNGVANVVADSDGLFAGFLQAEGARINGRFSDEVHIVSLVREFLSSLSCYQTAIEAESCEQGQIAHSFCSNSSSST